MGYFSRQPGQVLLRLGEIEVRYYVREPSPDRWNAVGLISGLLPEEGASPTSTSCPMIVGVGASRDEAIGDLVARVLSGDHPDLPSGAIIGKRFDKAEPVYSAVGACDESSLDHR